MVSLIPTYQKDIRTENKRNENYNKTQEQTNKEKSSQHIGNIKDKIIIDVISCVLLTRWETQFGITRMYKFINKNNNIYIWKTFNVISENIKQIKGTIKAHNTFNNINQTELTRCTAM